MSISNILLLFFLFCAAFLGSLSNSSMEEIVNINSAWPSKGRLFCLFRDD
ncbi:hypothetical protein ABFS83_06G116000 [Erythranthe nasuta]